MNLVKLTEAVNDGAVCLDGSPIAYYIRQNTSSNQVGIFIQFVDSILSLLLSVGRLLPRRFKATVIIKYIISLCDFE